MKILKTLLFILCLGGFLQSAFAHGHINAGAEDTNGSGSINAGDKLKMYFEPGTDPTALAYNAGTTIYGADGYNWNGYTTLTSLHQSTYPAEAPNYNSVGALSGSYVMLSLLSITGPAGARFAFYEADATDPSWIYQIGTGLLAGTGSFNLTEDAWFASDPSDPYGHIHGRMFAVDTAGTFTATWDLVDTQSATTGLLNSDSFTTTFTAVPEPSTCVLLLCGGILLAIHYRRRKIAPLRLTMLACMLILFAPRAAEAHGYAGKRFFPATLTTDDPFVADELSLPTFSTIVTPDEGGTRETEFSFDIAKEIFPHFGVEIATSIINTQTAGERGQTGLGNMELGAKYQFVTNANHELILSVGFDAEIGGTGTLRAGADSFSTWTPTLYFGKGMGDLPDCMSYLKPLAVTGTLGFAMPGRAYNQSFNVENGGEGELEIESNSDAFEFGFAIEYSIPYLQENVKDLGLRAPFNRLIPLVEFVFEQPVDRGQNGLITGTINPGILWSGKSFQLGVEAIIPMNSRTGNNVGLVAQLHFYLDDLLPSVFGHPIFGGKQ